MTVTTEYLKAHFEELIPATAGQKIDVRDEGKGTYSLRLVPKSVATRRNTLWGAMQGKIWMADDFNSPEVNKEIEDSFHESDLG